MTARPPSLFANALELRFHLSHLEAFEALHFLAPLSLLRLFTLSPPVARLTAALRVLRWPAHALYGAWEGRNVRRVGLFESEVVRAFEALRGLVKLVFVLEEIAVRTSNDVSTGGRH